MYPSKESEQSFKIWMGNEIERKNKEATTTNETIKEGEIYRNITERKYSKKDKFT